MREDYEPKVKTILIPTGRTLERHTHERRKEGGRKGGRDRGRKRGRGKTEDPSE